MTENAELKPCPFGCKRGLTVYQSLYCEYVVCDHCESTGPAAKTREEAIAAWNRRDSVEAPEAWRTMVKDLADELENEIHARYQGYPSNDRRYVRDLLTVKEARALLASGTESKNAGGQTDEAN